TSTGGLSGTPTEAGPQTFTVRAVDGAGATATSPAYSVTVGAPSLEIRPLTLPFMQAGMPYSVQVTASGGTAPYSYAGSNMPDGLTLSPAGLLEGTPTTPGTYTVSVTASDSSTGTSAPFTTTR